MSDECLSPECGHRRRASAPWNRTKAWQRGILELFTILGAVAERAEHGAQISAVTKTDVFSIVSGEQNGAVGLRSSAFGGA
jgi:hypothetical protein